MFAPVLLTSAIDAGGWPARENSVARHLTMARFAIIYIFRFGIVALAMSLTGTAFSQNPHGLPHENAPAKTQDGEITDGDRIIRLENSGEANKKQLADLETELEKTKSEESDANAAVQQLVMQIEETQKALQQAKDSGDSVGVEQWQTRLTELDTKHKLATEQFNLTIQTRKTIQEQITTLQQKIARDRESLDKLKGVPSPQPTESEAPAPTAPSTPGSPDSALDSQQPKTPNSAESEKTAPQEAVISKDLAKALKAVQDKAKSLQDIEQDLEALTESKTLLEKSIELESEKLESTRRKYDGLETSLEIAENKFNDKLAAGTPAGELQQLRTQISDTQQKLRDARGEIRSSTNRLQELRNQLLALQADETQLVKHSGVLRREMATAKRSEWVLKVRDYLYTTVPKVVVILVLTLVLWMLIKLLCRRSRIWIAHAGRGTTAERQNRAHTLAGVFENTGNVVIVIGSLLMILDAAGVPITAVLGGAGVVGLAVAFGAQSLIKDYFCGFILLLESQFKVNDFVTIGSQSGFVERITLRITVLRDFEGNVHFIPSGQITSVTNATMDWSRAVLEIGVAYKENVDQVIEELKELTGQLKEDPEFAECILGDVEMLGVNNLGDSSVIVKFGVKTRPDKKWPVKRELLRRIKNTFDTRGIEIPFPHQTVIHRNENSNPARRVA